MRRRLYHLTLVLSLALVGVARLAGAAVTTEYAYRVLFDTDNNPATGCSVSVDDATVGSTTFDGVERLVTVRVMRTGTAGTVTGITFQDCVGGTIFGPPQTVSPGGWPVGKGDGVGGGDVIEGFVPAAALGNGGLARVAFAASLVPIGSDVMLSTTGELDGAPILFTVPRLAGVPLLSPVGLALGVLLLGGVAWWALRRRPQRAVLLALLVSAGMAATALALTILTDGQVGDWGTLPPVATDPTGDSTLHNPAEDLVAGFLTADNTNVYFRMDVANLTPCEGKTNGMTCDAGMDFASAATCEDNTCGTCVPQASPSPRFVDNLDGTITDRSTCLVWEKKDQSGTLHDWENYYQWSSTGTIPDVTVFLAGLNNHGFAGHHDWRLPKEDGRNGSGGPNELESILAGTYSCTVGPPCVDAAFNTSCEAGCSATGATPCSCTHPDGYWSSSQEGPNAVWFVDFHTGYVAADDKGDIAYVRAVRGGS